MDHIKIEKQLGGFLVQLESAEDSCKILRLNGEIYGEGTLKVSYASRTLSSGQIVEFIWNYIHMKEEVAMRSREVSERTWKSNVLNIDTPQPCSNVDDMDPPLVFGNPCPQSGTPTSPIQAPSEVPSSQPQTPTQFSDEAPDGHTRDPIPAAGPGREHEPNFAPQIVENPALPRP